MREDCLVLVLHVAGFLDKFPVGKWRDFGLVFSIEIVVASVNLMLDF